MNIAEILGISSVSDVNVTNQTKNVENTNEDFASDLSVDSTTGDLKGTGDWTDVANFETVVD